MGVKFVYDVEIGDNTKFVYTPKTEQKAKFVYEELDFTRNYEKAYYFSIDIVPYK